jgi:hypothetical protein
MSSLPVRIASRHPAFSEIEEEAGRLMGEVLTVLDATLNKEQAHAAKQLVRAQFGRRLKFIRQMFHPPVLSALE